MKEKIKIQKGFIQIPLLIGIIVSIIAAAGISYGAMEYSKTSKIIREAEQLAKEGKYDEAIEKLEHAQNKLLGKMILKQKINAELDTNKKLLEDKSEYNQGIEEFNKGNWDKAKELLSKVSETFPHYQDAKNKIEEVQKKITEKEVAKAVEKVEEETQRKVQEEKEARKAAEAQLELERQISRAQISELQQKRQEAEKQWAEAETKRKIEELFRIGNLLQDYYNEIRKFKEISGESKKWWLYEANVVGAHIASYLAQHDIGLYRWPEEEAIYHSKTGSYSYVDAKKILDNILFLPYAAGVDYYNDSDFEKIYKILNFIHAHIHYEHDFNEIFRAPVETIGLKSGDCDDFSILVSALLADAGIRSGIIFVKSKDGTQAHAMVIFQSKEFFPLYYYSDLTSYGSPAGKWYILEPQFTYEENLNRDDWFTQWNLTGAATVWEAGPPSFWCNGKYWTPCPSGQKFHCPQTGDPFCYSADAIICNDKAWTPCPIGQKFICSPVGDPYCE